jgi:hypothetical protein
MMAVVPIFHGAITPDARLVLDEHERDRRRMHLGSLIGKRVEVIVRKVRTQRSLDQNAYLHAVPFALLAEYWGEDIETTKLLCLGECFGWKDTRDGHRVPIKPSTSGLTTEEGSHLIEWLPAWAMREFGVSIPLPQEGQ